MATAYTALLNAIDAQDLPSVEVFIQRHPELDYSCVCPNGMSALWWALMPPPGKTISLNLVAFLINYLKPNGEKLVSPIQSFAGLTPRQYFLSLLWGDKGLVSLLEHAENTYEAPVAAGVGINDLGRLAQDTQNVHDPRVVALARNNTQRLYTHYINNLKHTLDSITINKAISELNHYIALEKNSSQRE